jgi:tRNA(Ile)-lysidine synthase
VCAEPIESVEFAAWIERLGPFEAAPHLAVAVSGGADSLALALLARDWVRPRRGRCTALIVDHRLRRESAAEAALTATRLQQIGILPRVLALQGLGPGPALAERARTARYAALQVACAEAGIVHLLLGHHAADQAETVAMRLLRGSGPDGLAAMAALVETASVRLLRPLLTAPPVRLRATLQAAGVEWIEDPSNRAETALRGRLRALRRDPDGTGPATRGAVAEAAARGRQRAAHEAETAAWLGRHARLHPEGYAVLDALPEAGAPLAALLRIVAGASRPPPADAVLRWLHRPRAATLGGVALRPAGRLAPGGWLLLREAAGMQPPVAASRGAVWDGRFRWFGKTTELATLGALGADAPSGRGQALLRRTLPSLRAPEQAIAVPHLDGNSAYVVWSPQSPAAGAGFLPADA